MPLINRVEHDLIDAEFLQPVDLVITDGDGTLFRHNSVDLLPGAEDYISNLKPNHLALVSANPDKALAYARADVICADSVSIPRVKTWVKCGLFHHAISNVLDKEDVEMAAVLGNRWMMDVALGRLALFRRNIPNNYGVFFRVEPTNEKFDELVTGPLENLGAFIAKNTRLDTFIRPRKDDLAQV
ncbi:hypothetical protein KC950_03335 [Candidatus Saccharibacteria bacterium]|nr:hypothetical protein [Candidatus Saccharibacteria bacterium]